MAALPAALMCAGVGKSGSPTLKSTTRCPARRSRSASAATFMVADSATCASRCANIRVLGAKADLKVGLYVFDPHRPDGRPLHFRSTPTLTVGLYVFDPDRPDGRPLRFEQASRRRGGPGPPTSSALPVFSASSPR